MEQRKEKVEHMLAKKIKNTKELSSMYQTLNNEFTLFREETENKILDLNN